MGRYEILSFLMSHKDEWFKIKELSQELRVSERNIRRAVVRLEADGMIKGRCRGNYKNWNREFSIKEGV